MRIEAGQLDRAAVLAADLTDLGRAARLRPMAAVGGHPAGHRPRAGRTRRRRPRPEPGCAAHIATMTTFLDTLRTVGLNLYLTFYDGVVARLLIAAGQPEQARARLDTALALAHDTGMCFYDAELLRLRAHTHTDPEPRQADIGAAARTRPPPGRDPVRTARRARRLRAPRPARARRPHRRRQPHPRRQRVAGTRAGPGPTAVNRPADQVAISGAGRADLSVVAGARQLIT